jgi:hypothetical protein
MRSISAAAVTALAAGHAVIVSLVKLAFPSGTIALNSSTHNLTYDGNTYLAASGLGKISPITERPGEMPGVQLELLQIDSAMISLALDDADQVQGTLVTISTAILDSTTYQIVEVEVDWVGYADKMTIVEDGEKATIGMTAESKAVDLLRGQSLLYTDADQKALYPADEAFEYVVSQSDQPVVWPTREWFFK